MRRYVLKTEQLIHPFESSASELPVLNKTIFEHQEEVFRHLKVKEKPFLISSLEEIIPSTSPAIVYRDDIYFNIELVMKFLDEASAVGKPARLAFLDTDPCIILHACYPMHNMEHVENLYLGDFFFFPPQVQKKDFTPIIIDTESIPISCFSLPTLKHGFGQRFLKAPLAAGEISFPPLQLQVPRFSYIAVKHWTHLLFANFTCGIHCQARKIAIQRGEHTGMFREILCYLSKQRGPILIGKNCQIDPTATIIGPTTIGDGVIIGPNVTIASGCIGDQAVLEPNSIVWLGVLGARSSLLTNRNIVMSCVMSNSIINADIRFSIVGNHSFLGAGSHITDCILRNDEESEQKMNSQMVRVLAGDKLVNSGYYILGPAIGNRVKIGSGTIIYPGRMIESDSLILPNQGYNIINK